MPFHRNKYFLLGVLIIILGIATYLLNFERQTITVTAITSQGKVLEYYAPSWDPFPHYVDLLIDSENDLDLIITIVGVNTQTEKLPMNEERKHIIVYPDETLIIEFQNPQSTVGTIKTTLWCDSWNYAAASFFIIGTSLLIIGMWKAQKRSN